MLRTLALFSLISALISFGSLGFAADGFFIDFKDGVQAYQTKDYKKAEESFTKALAQSPRSAAVLANLGLIESQLGKKGLAIAHFRQALSVDPSLSLALSGLKMTLASLPVKEIPHRLETYESIRGIFLETVSLLSYLVLTALFLFGGGWIVLSYLGQKKRAQAEQVSAPNPPMIGIIVCILFVASAALSLLKVWDLSQTRATLIENKVSVQSAPGVNQAALFDLYEGLEVIVRQKQEGWAQVSYPGGLSGWIPDKSILVTTL